MLRIPSPLALPVVPHLLSGWGRALAVCLVLTAPLAASAQSTTGKVSGRVVDAATGDGLPGVTVRLGDTGRGAATDADGEYAILNLSPGTYDLIASYIGYQTAVREGIRVSINRTTKVDFELTEAVLGGEEVVVTAVNDAEVQRDVSFSTSYVRQEDIARLPVTSIEDVMTRQAGVTSDDFGLQVRGLSENDVAVYVDGMSYNDNRNDRPNTSINYDMVEEIEILTGGFSAEYGNARAGVINITTNQDLDEYTGSFRLDYSPAALKHFGPYAFSEENWWDWGRFQSFETTEDRNGDGEPDFIGWNAYSEDPSRNVYNLTPENNKRLWDYQHRTDVLTYGDRPDYTVQASVGGPLFPFLPNNKTTFYAGLYRRFEAYPYQLSTPGVLNQNVNLKLTHQVSPGTKLMLFGLAGEDQGAGYRINNQHDYISNAGFIVRYNLMNSGEANTLFAVDNLSNDLRWTNRSAGLRWTHMLSNSTFYDVRLQGAWREYGADQPPDHPIESGRSQYTEFFFLPDRDGNVRGFPAFPRYYSYHYSTFTHDQNGYWLHRLQHSRTFDESSAHTYEGQVDLTSQVTSRHLVKAGAGVTLDGIDEWRYAYGLEEDGEGGYLRAGEIDDTQWNAEILHGHAYAQDKMEFEGFVVNAGLRLDWYHPLTPMWDLSGNWTNDTLLTAGSRERFLANVPKRDLPSQVYLSPRLGIAHPITTQSKIYFNYGHFVDILDPNTLYWIQLGTIERLEAIGNPDLKLPRSILYEVGYEHVLSFLRRQLNVRGTVSGYLRDIRGDIDEVVFAFSPSLQYDTFRNSEYEETRGLEVKLNSGWRDVVRGYVNFEQRFTERGYFGPNQVRPDDPFLEQENAANEARERARGTIEPQPILNAGVSLLAPSTFGPEVAGFRPLAGWAASLDYTWRRGTAFHWDLTGQVPVHIRNHRWEDYQMANLRLSRRFTDLAGLGMEVYIDVYNVFNVRNFNVATYGAGLTQGTYQSPGDPSYVFAAHGLDAEDEFNRYMERIEELGLRPGAAVEYAYMPKREYVTYLNPRDVRFGLRLTF